MASINQTPARDPDRWARVHLEGDSRQPFDRVAVTEPRSLRYPAGMLRFWKRHPL